MTGRAWLPQLHDETPRGRIALRESVYRALLEAIVTGRIAPGQHLVEQAIADQYGVSRISVREAIQDLVRDGLVETYPNRGAFTASFTARDVEEIFSLRESLEVLGVRLAANRRTRTDLARLEDIHERMQHVEASGDRLLATEVDTEFHHAIMRAAAHRRALGTWESISAQVTMVVYSTTSTYSQIDGLAGRHRAIVDAIAGRDPDLAATTIAEHIRVGCDHLLEALRSPPDPTLKEQP